MIREASATGRVLIVDETRDNRREWARACWPLCWSTGYTGAVDRVASKDSFIPLR